MRPRIALSLAAFPRSRDVEAFLQNLPADLGWDPSFELSYQFGPRELARLEGLEGRVLSGHAPCPGTEYFPNLGSGDPEVVEESLQVIRASARTAASYGGSVLVLHPGYATDGRMPAEFTERKAALEAERVALRRYEWLREKSICRPRYCDSPVYRDHLGAAVQNLRHATAVCAEEGVRLAAENLNPRLTYLFQRPAELEELVRAVPGLTLCVDAGHLWMASLVPGFDFTAGLRQILDTGRVVSAHVHDNRSVLGARPRLSDDHGAPGTGLVPLEEALHLLLMAGVPNWILESTVSPLQGLRVLMAASGGL